MKIDVTGEARVHTHPFSHSGDLISKRLLVPLLGFLFVCFVWFLVFLVFLIPSGPELILVKISFQVVKKLDAAALDGHAGTEDHHQLLKGPVSCHCPYNFSISYTLTYICLTYPMTGSRLFTMEAIQVSKKE